MEDDNDGVGSMRGDTSETNDSAPSSLQGLLYTQDYRRSTTVYKLDDDRWSNPSSGVGLRRVCFEKSRGV